MPDASAPKEMRLAITAMPMGAAKLRMTMERSDCQAATATIGASDSAAAARRWTGNAPGTPRAKPGPSARITSTACIVAAGAVLHGVGQGLLHDALDCKRGGRGQVLGRGALGGVCDVKPVRAAGGDQAVDVQLRCWFKGALFSVAEQLHHAAHLAQ